MRGGGGGGEQLRGRERARQERATLLRTSSGQGGPGLSLVELWGLGFGVWGLGFRVWGLG